LFFPHSVFSRSPRSYFSRLLIPDHIGQFPRIFDPLHSRFVFNGLLPVLSTDCCLSSALAIRFYFARFLRLGGVTAPSREIVTAAVFHPPPGCCLTHRDRGPYPPFFFPPKPATPTVFLHLANSLRLAPGHSFWTRGLARPPRS